MQQQQVAAALAAAGEATQQWLAKLRGMEQLLYSAQSAQFLDIRRREAEAYKVGRLQTSVCEPQNGIARYQCSEIKVNAAVSVCSEDVTMNI